MIEIVGNALCTIDQIDKNGDMFRYPTTYSLEYKFDKNLDAFKKMYGIDGEIEKEY